MPCRVLYFVAYVQIALYIPNQDLCSVGRFVCFFLLQIEMEYFVLQEYDYHEQQCPSSMTKAGDWSMKIKQMKLLEGELLRKGAHLL